MDWMKLIDEIKATGMTQAEVAEKCECSVGNLSDIRNGNVKNPAYPLGKCLVDLHARKVGVRKTAKKAA